MLCRWMQMFKMELVNINKFQLNSSYVFCPGPYLFAYPVPGNITVFTDQQIGKHTKNLHLCVQNPPEQTMTVIRKYWKLIKL